jgi:uncharacterized protein (DUF4415 family)
MTENKSVSKLRLNKADDASELTEAWFANADVYKADKLVRRGRPAGSGKKELVSLRLDKKALAAFRSTGKGWQVRISEAVVRSAKRLSAKRPG